ncbi:MAG: hypothetical protein ACOC6K_01800, partial [Thermodesulfobacteriota bacterium]
ELGGQGRSQAGAWERDEGLDKSSPYKGLGGELKCRAGKRSASRHEALNSGLYRSRKNEAEESIFRWLCRYYLESKLFAWGPFFSPVFSHTIMTPRRGFSGNEPEISLISTPTEILVF